MHCLGWWHMVFPFVKSGPRQEPVLALYDEESGMQVHEVGDFSQDKNRSTKTGMFGGCFFWMIKKSWRTSHLRNLSLVVFLIFSQKFQVKTSYENFQNARRKYPNKPFLGHRPVSILGLRSVLFDLEGVAMELKTKIEEDWFHSLHIFV